MIAGSHAISVPPRSLNVTFAPSISTVPKYRLQAEVPFA